VTRQSHWLSIIGIGEDGLDGLSPAARRLIAQASLVVGGARHLKLAGLSRERTLTWRSPIDGAMPDILARRGDPVCVLASGDPFFYGVGSLLMRHIPPEEMVCLPAPSAFSLVAARLGWSLQDCIALSLHGRALEAIIRHLQPRARLLALSWDCETPAKLAKLLVQRGMGRSKLIVCEALGGAGDRMRDFQADDVVPDDIAPLNTIALEVVAEAGARVIARASGLPDDLFEHDGQITRREIRAMTLSALAPRRGELLWDVGAGSGSVAIEWMLCDTANRAIAIERSPERAARIARNAAALGVPALEIVEGRAPEALGDLAPPDAIFVGGAASNGVLLDYVYSVLRPGGRLVVNAVTLQGQGELVRRFERYGGDLAQANIARADRVGRFHGWRPAMPVVQWALEKSWSK
jgi:precorrin-6Y C5,15-methyltransferase (decarboxylating)